VLNGDPANLFVTFPTYTRGAMTLQGYREIVGDEVFFQFTRTILERFGHDNISTAEFIALAMETSAFEGARADLLAQYLQEWLYLESRPTILPEAFT
jgi:aminopeptidase N